MEGIATRASSQLLLCPFHSESLPPYLRVLVCCIWPHVNHLWETLSSLRFASRMRCIENHPQRNSLVAGTTAANSSLTRSLQQKIESLKKELAMRDIMCGYAMYGAPSQDTSPLDRPPVLEVLTKPQLASCHKMATRFALSGDERDIDVRSLAEVKAMATFLRAALWSSCGGNETSIRQILSEAAGDRVAVESVIDFGDQNLTVPPSDPVAEERELEQEEVDRSDQQLMSSPTTSRPNAREDCAPSYQSRSPPTPTPHLPLPTEVEEEEYVRGDGDPFSLFKHSEGLELHQRYEELKRQLKEAKGRQKILVKQVNQTKIDIDSIDQQDDETEQGTDRQQQLLELKTTYKQTRSELIFCKEDIVDLNRKKQIALNALVAAYESFICSRQLAGSESGEQIGVERDVLEGMVVEDILSNRRPGAQDWQQSPT